MTYNFKFAHRKARLRGSLLAALILNLASCNTADLLTSDSSVDPQGLGDGSTIAGETDLPSFATSFAGGIPFGTYALPTSWFGSYYNGALRNIAPDQLRSELAAIKSRGGKVVLMFAGNERWYKDANHHFSFTKWKDRIDRFRRISFSSFITDGTIIAHYLIDEPNDPHNWGGQAISGNTLEEMAKYSKQIWPGLATVVRTDATYLAKWSGYHYLDAAWAQYVSRKGSPGDYIKANISAAQNRGLALITGLNLIDGNAGSKMTASQVKSWGSTLLSYSYPCAFVSWTYNSTYLSSSGIKDAMRYLRYKAQSRSTKSCRS
ncbi:MAG TPA: hypothetical protein VGJ36_01835 [Gemmatimonadales bacterium]|jgi:hypothetical protein